MDTILYLRLINRILIKEDNFDFLAKILLIANLYGLSVTICNQGIFQEGPFISQIVKHPDKTLTVKNLKSFISEISEYVDFYPGVMNYTVAEFYIKIMIDKDGFKSVPIRSEIVFYYNLESKEYKVLSLDDTIDRVKQLKPKFQNRIYI